MIELALPAGTLENAIVAFEHGADGVYFGLKEFSARKGAGNFSFEDLSKIRKYSLERGKKTYITINTLIDDKSLPSLYETLDKVSKYGSDGIICQDLGVARLIKRDFPTLPLHGSTQLAVHTTNGVKELQELGFERVVLSRELNLSEIRKIREECPDIELKVFIHGALCYGFSGLCMASFLKTGRSANEGSCAQICRTWFKDLTTGERLYPFSLEDMDAGELVKELEDIGIDSLKVEGRLKGNEYVASVASYYRAILDNLPHKNLHGAVESSFQRKAGTGYLDYTGPGHKNLTTGSYTGHIGEHAGYVISSNWNTIKIKEDVILNPYDGLMVLLEKDDGLINPIKFSCHILKRDNTGTILSFDGKEGILKGAELRRISNSSLKEKVTSTDIPLYKEPLDITIEVEKEAIKVNNRKYQITIEEGKQDGWRDAIAKIFMQTGNTSFSLGNLSIINKSSFISPFIRLSELKRIRREAYEEIAPNGKESKQYSINIPSNNTKKTILPPRSALSTINAPWNIEGVQYGDYWYITMPPVTYNEEGLFKRVLENALEHENVRIGLNNIAQLKFAKAHPEFEYFADIYLYLSNREAAILVYENTPNLVGGYLWLERNSHEKPWTFEPTIVRDFKPPLFISRSCFRHDSLKLPCQGCSRHHGFTIEQNGIHYDVFVDECQTVVEIKSK